MLVAFFSLAVFLTPSSAHSDSFARLVREVTSPDLAKMGLEILSFTIKDVNDDVNHLESLGQKRTAEVIRDADIATAETGRDAGIAVRFLAGPG